MEIFNSLRADHRGFGSDNHSGAHPLILQALAQSNLGHQPSYGTDPISHAAIRAFQKEFACEAKVFFVFNGTAANTLALKALGESYNAILCSNWSHVHLDECGAPEFFTGGKVLAMSTRDGKITPAMIEKELIRSGDQHFSQPKIVTFAQPTEVGTIYSQEEIRTLCDVCHAHGLYVHVDGARLSLAAEALGLSFAQMITDCGVDVVSFGGTKNGLIFGEAVVFLRPELAKNFQYIRKQGLQLPSKSRFVAAQFLRYFQDELWRQLARHSLDKAQELHTAVREIPGVEVTQAVQSNAVFARIPKAWLKPAREKHFFYVWNESPDSDSYEVRWMTSFDTTSEDIDSFRAVLLGLSGS